MAYLRFVPSCCLYALVPCEGEFEFDMPLKPGDVLKTDLVFGPVIELVEAYLWEELKGIDNPFLEVSLWSAGEEVTEDNLQLGEIRRSNDELSLVLRFPMDKDNVLIAVVAGQDEEDTFPFELGSIVSIQLLVERVYKTQWSSDNEWGVILVPIGDEIGGRILAEVELVERP